MSKKKYNEVKYDKRDKKIYLILGVLSLIITIVSFVFLCTDLAENIIDAVIVGVVIVTSCFVLPVLLFCSWAMYFDCCAYLKRLEKYGFKVPYNKKDYDNNIEKLLNGEIKSFEEPSKESVILAGIAWFAAVLMGAFSVFYFIRFSHMLDNVAFFGIISIVITICWIVFGCILFSQRQRERYRDDVEFDRLLRKRMHLVEGIVYVIILGGITVIAASTMYNMTEYIEKSKEMNEESSYTSMHMEVCCDEVNSDII